MESIKLKTFIIFDGHGYRSDKEILLKNKIIFLCPQDEILTSVVFNKYLANLMESFGTCVNIEDGRLQCNEHFFLPLLGSQLKSSKMLHSINKEKNLGLYLKSGILQIKIAENEYLLYVLRTKHHPTTKIRVIQIRIKGQSKTEISLSNFEKYALQEVLQMDEKQEKQSFEQIESCLKPWIISRRMKK